MEMRSHLQAFNPLTQTTQSFRTLLDVVKHHEKELQILLKAGYAERFRQHFVDLLNSTSTPNQIKLRYANAYWAGALSSIIIDWVNHQQDLPLEELAQLGSQLMTQGVEVIKEVGNPCD